MYRINDRLEFRKSWINWLALPIYAGVAMGMTWPLAARLGAHLPGGTTDTLVHYWNGWWAGQALAAGQSPYYTLYLFYPRGIDLVLHNFAWWSIAIWLALQSWLGGFAAYNVAILLNLALCGFAVFLLTLNLVQDRRAAFLAGLIYMCWPNRLAQLDHPNLISTQWIPLFLLFLHRTMHRTGGRWRNGALAGVFLALIGYTRWQQLIPAAIVSGIYLLFALPALLQAPRRKLLPLALVGGMAAVAFLPFALLLAGQQNSAPADLLVEGEETTMQTDLLAYLTPGGSHPVLGELTEPAYNRYYADRWGGRRFAAYLGATTLLLAALGGVRRGRRASLPWVLMALVLLVLALGPVLRVNGQLYPDVPMPYSLLARPFVVRLMRVPDRFNLFLALPVAVLAGYGASGVLAFARPRGRLGVPWLLGLAVLFEYLAIPAPLQDAQASSFYAQMAAEPGDFSLLNLPLDPQKAKGYMFAQTIHHRPILQGKTARFPKGTHAYLDNNPWLRVLRQHDEMPPELPDVSRQLAVLAQDGIRYIVLNKTQVGADRLAHWRRYLLFSPRFEDQQIAVYTTTPLAGRDFTLTHELVPGLGLIHVIASTNCLNPGRVWAADVGWGATAGVGQNYSVRLALVEPDDTVVYSELFPGGPAGAVSWGYYALSVPPSLPGGNYRVTLALADPETGATQGETAVLGPVTVSQSPCQFPILPDAVSVNALFGNELRLHGYRLERDGDRLKLTLFWRAERRMESDYKVFVHIFDPATGVPAAQDDAMPHRWGYPTRFWAPGEVATDTIPISLGQAPAGEYGVAVGVYHPVTLERLPVVDGNGQLLPDGRLVLPGEKVQVE